MREAGRSIMKYIQTFHALRPARTARKAGDARHLSRQRLKDRKGRELSFEDIRHYQTILKILAETDRIMKTIRMDL